MAIQPSTQFLPAQILPPSAQYPFGSARNVTSEGSGDGTPWEAVLLNDFWGFFQKLLYDAGMTPNGFSDDVTSSQYFDALQTLLGAPAGLQGAWMSDQPIPDGWIAMDGATISRTIYSRLFAAIGETYGAGDGLTTFRLPDVRGRFARFLDMGAGNDPNAGTRTNRGDGVSGDNVGTKQGHAFGSHSHLVGRYIGVDVGAGGVGPGNYPGGFDNVSTSSSGSSETRPINIAVIGIIKY